MPEKKRAEGWIAFIVGRFIPQFWAGFKPRLNTTMIAISAAVLVLAAQLYLGRVNTKQIL